MNLTIITLGPGDLLPYLPAIQSHKCMTGQNVFEIAVVSGARMVLDWTVRRQQRGGDM